jgi:hypothetical protein
MITRDQVLATLSRHIGAERGVHIAQLVAEITGELLPDPVAERRVRQCISELREEGGHVCAHPQTGYFIAASAAELERYYIEFLRARALHSLMLISRAKNIALPELIGQLRLVEKA